MKDNIVDLFLIRVVLLDTHETWYECKVTKEYVTVEAVIVVLVVVVIILLIKAVLVVVP